jgi:hypothetical protein
MWPSQSLKVCLQTNSRYCSRRQATCGYSRNQCCKSGRRAEKLREELTLVRMERHSGQLEELDVEGILAFAERVMPRAADLWVQASLEQRQRFQQLFFPEGIAFDGNRFVRTAATAPAFRYLRGIESGNENLVDLTGIEPVTS